ncbi:hypothetical protein [Lactococcus lactis]|uniref:hypothetical protein n=1 Tax=Lactococcus lactis TaxID=1358 RepID=UPI00071DEB34|nr:hypothetical protein [Lactococcus lactis]KSU11079.1 Phage protein [Lactococcus lactis subsp. lactis]MCT0052845.1 hypothetical protein [Lactococcus lactis subsp. lactis]
MKLSEIEAVGRTKIFTGEFRLYKDMSELNEYIKEVDVFTSDQMQEFMVENVRHALTLYGAKVCGFHLEQLEKSEIEKIIQDLFTEDTKND